MLKTGWLDVDGTFIKCEAESHWKIANQICDRRGYSTMFCDPEDAMLSHGWVHITVSCLFGHEWRIHWGRHPLTESQKTFLWDYFEERPGELPVGRLCKERWERENEY